MTLVLVETPSPLPAACRTQQPWNVEYPKAKIITPAQRAYVEGCAVHIGFQGFNPENSVSRLCAHHKPADLCALVLRLLFPSSGANFMAPHRFRVRALADGSLRTQLPSGTAAGAAGPVARAGSSTALDAKQGSCHLELLRYSHAAVLACLRSYLNQFENALYGSAFADPVNGWRKYGNETTFIDW